MDLDRVFNDGVRDMAMKLAEEVSSEKIHEYVNESIHNFLNDPGYYRQNEFTAKVMENVAGCFAKRYVDENYTELLKRIDTDVLVKLIYTQAARNIRKDI